MVRPNINASSIFTKVFIAWFSSLYYKCKDLHRLVWSPQTHRKQITGTPRTALTRLQWMAKHRQSDANLHRWSHRRSALIKHETFGLQIPWKAKTIYQPEISYFVVVSISDEQYKSIKKQLVFGKDVFDSILKGSDKLIDGMINPTPRLPVWSHATCRRLSPPRIAFFSQRKRLWLQRSRPRDEQTSGVHVFAWKIRNWILITKPVKVSRLSRASPNP